MIGLYSVFAAAVVVVAYTTVTPLESNRLTRTYMLWGLESLCMLLLFWVFHMELWQGGSFVFCHNIKVVEEIGRGKKNIFLFCVLLLFWVFYMELWQGGSFVFCHNIKVVEEIVKDNFCLYLVLRIF
jgi:hypothetical protein